MEDVRAETSRTSWLDRPLLAIWNLNWEKALYGLLILLAILTRLWDLGVRVMSHDETVHVQWSWFLYQGRGYSHTPLSHGPFLFHATALSYYLFGDTDFSARLVVALMGILLVALPYTLRRWLGRTGALVTSFLFLISPSLLYYSRYIRHDIPIIVWTLIAILAIFRYLERSDEEAAVGPAGRLSNDKRTVWLLILAGALSLMFATKEVAFIYIAVFGLFLIMLFIARVGPGFWRSDAARSLLLATFGLIGIVVIAMTLFLFSLNLVQLFPIRHRDCGQAPVPNEISGAMECTENDCSLIQGRCQRPLPVVAADDAIEFDQAGARIAIRITRPEMFLMVLIIAIFTVATGVAVYMLLKRLMPFKAGDHPALDLTIFIGSFTLPSLSPIAINGLSRIVSRLFFGIDAAFDALDYSEAGLLRSAGMVFILLAVSVAVGLWWDRRRWPVAATVFYVIFVVLFTTVFTNGNGLASGMVGSLGYWLEQQEVQRGSQPWYYYGLLVPLYEYLPLLGFLTATAYVLSRWLRYKPVSSTPPTPETSLSEPLGANPTAPGKPAEDDGPETDAAEPSPPMPLSSEIVFVLFLILWTAVTWLAYSAAGEKMPWLTTHFAVPLALATGWLVGRLIDSIDWRTVWRRGAWILLLVAPVGFAALVQTVSPWLRPSAERPFSGSSIAQLNATMQFISALLVLLGVGAAFYWVRQRIGSRAVGRTLAILAFAVLAVLTIRTAWLFAYVNYDYATEFLVYAHASPDMREVMEQVEDISRRTSGERSLNIGYTGDGSYPLIWYLRNYPNAVQLPNPPSRPDLEKPVIIAGDTEWGGIEPYLGDNFTCNQYNFLWWPMQDYYNLNWDRIRYALTNPAMRSALWDIIFRRDYHKYEAATDKTVRLSEWPLRDGLRLCIQREVAAQVWSESAGPITLAPVVEEPGPELPSYEGLELPVAAERVISTLGAFGNLNAPHDMAQDAAGNLYVADSNNHRIVKLSPDGAVLDTWDSTWWQGVQWKPGCLDANDQPLSLANGEFCEPWGITVGPDNRVYVADTWNHRIQVFTTEGEFLNTFGVFGQSGSSVSSAPGEFYGPRDVVVDSQGNIYVSDTGNKRIQVFGPDFAHQRSFGGPGIVEGRLEEPVGLALGPDNNLYVADTWNTRLQVFTLVGTFVREWPVLGWDSQSVANKPYLDVDSSGQVFVSDPEGSRVLVFNSEGEPLAVLGGPTSNLFQLPTGILVDDQDRVWISDATSQRLLQLPAQNYDPGAGQP